MTGTGGSVQTFQNEDTRGRHAITAAALRRGQALQIVERRQGRGAREAAHGERGSQRAADRRAVRVPEQATAEAIVKLHAGHTCGLAVRHAGNRR